MICAHYIYGLGDMVTKLRDWGDGKYCLSIGNQFSIRVIGTLDELAQVFSMAEAHIENERIRKQMPKANQEDHEMERNRMT